MSTGFLGRLGFTLDTSAVPDRTIERQYLDGRKMGFAAGGTVALAAGWDIDAGFEMIAGGARTVADNTDEARDAGWLQRANVAPGDYEGQVYTFELALRRGF